MIWGVTMSELKLTLTASEKEIIDAYRTYGAGSAELQRVLMKLTASEKRFDTPLR